MAITQVGTATFGNTAAGTTTSPIATSFPTGWQAGDIAVLIGHVSGVALTLSPSTGWPAAPGTWPVAEGSNSRMWMWGRTLQAGDTPPTLTPSGAITCGWTLVVLRGAASIVQAAAAVVAGTALTLPPLTGVAAGSALVEAAHSRVASGTIPSNLTPAAAYTEVADHATSRVTSSANLRAHASLRVVDVAGSYGGEQVTSDVTGSMIGALVEVTAATSSVSRSVATSWNVASVVSGTTATAWRTAAQVAEAKATAWATAVQVVGSRTTGWRTAAEVAAAVGSRWNTAALATAATATGWHVHESTGADVTTGWRVLTAVTADTTTGWAVQGAVLPPAGRGTVTLPRTNAVALARRNDPTTLVRSEVRLR